MGYRRLSILSKVIKAYKKYAQIFYSVLLEYHKGPTISTKTKIFLLSLFTFKRFQLSSGADTYHHEEHHFAEAMKEATT